MNSQYFDNIFDNLSEPSSSQVVVSSIISLEEPHLDDNQTLHLSSLSDVPQLDPALLQEILKNGEEEFPTTSASVVSDLSSIPLPSLSLQIKKLPSKTFLDVGERTHIPQLSLEINNLVPNSSSKSSQSSPSSLSTTSPQRMPLKATRSSKSKRIRHGRYYGSNQPRYNYYQQDHPLHQLSRRVEKGLQSSDLNDTQILHRTCSWIFGEKHCHKHEIQKLIATLSHPDKRKEQDFPILAQAANKINSSPEIYNHWLKTVKFLESQKQISSLLLTELQEARKRMRDRESKARRKSKDEVIQNSDYVCSQQLYLYL